MKTRFSSSTGCFYPFEFDYGENLPPDVIEVPQSDYEAAMSRPIGHSFTFVNGRLVVTAPASIPFSERSAPYMTEVRATRELILNRLAGIGMAAVINGDTGTAGAIARTRQQLLDITQAPTVAAAIAAEDLPALEQAVKGRYKEIAAPAPLAIRTAFNQVS